MLTDRTIAQSARKAKAKGSDRWLSDDTKARGVGRLQFRASPSGEARAYFRYLDSQGKQDRLLIGVYDGEGRAGLTLKTARARAGELSRLYQAGHRDLRAYLEHQQAEERGRIEAARREREESERLAKSGTLENLCDGYVAHLERQGKQAAADVRRIFKRNVIDEFPELAAMRAASITHRDISAILAKLIDRGAGRTAAKARSYLRAAFAAALASESDPTVHPDLHGFGLTANPAAIVPAKPLAKFTKPRERVLSASELRGLLAGLEKRPGFRADAVMLHLLLGGQRTQQLVRVRKTDVDLEGRTITLYDPKGNRQHPRRHTLPLTDRAAEVVKRLLDAQPESPFLLSLRRKVAARSETVSEIVTEISAAMLKAKEAREPFELRDLRRTCETMLAAMGVSRDLRAQLQSHGLGGVQARHYDRHDYAQEKRAALEAWGARLEQIATGAPGGNVVPLRQAQ